MMNACAVYVPATVRTPSMRDAERGQPLRILVVVVADSRHDHRLAAERLEVVGDVAGAAAPLAAHFADQERHREHVRLVGQDVARETDPGTP